MAYNLATTELSNIFMTADDPLGSSVLSKKFRILLQNDRIINQLFSNTIGIWQCNWYYDSGIKGYSIGDAVWLNTEDTNDFVKSRASIIKTYTDLNSQVLNKLPVFDDKDESVINEYKAAMSGYTDPALGKDVVLPPIFDIGDFSKPIQLAVSLKNNNKELLSNDSAWKKLFVDSDEDEEKIRWIIDTKEDEVLKRHLVNYHLSGYETEVRAMLSDYLDAQQDFAYTNLSSSWYSKYEESPKTPNYGVDYVLYSIRKPYLLNGTVSQYQGVRYWKSGLIEHFGTIATDNEFFLSSKGNELVVPFNWKIANDGSGAKVYESGELAKSLTTLLSAAETISSMVPPKDNFINLTYEKKDVSVLASQSAIPFKRNNYKLTVNAIYQTQDGLTDNYIPIAYGEQDVVQKWNSNYLTNEIEEQNRTYFKIRLGTRVVPPYISYYAIGKGSF